MSSSPGARTSAPQPLRPAILVVDDERASLLRAEDELMRRFGADYRVVARSDPDEAIAELEAMRAEGSELAIALADVWMPGLDGTDLLARVAELYPRAKRGLLVEFGGWGDERTARAILRAMAVGGIDYYVLKPWRSPDEYFDRTIAEFLHEWSRMRPSGPRQVLVVGPVDAPRSHEILSLLSRNSIPHAGVAATTPEGRDALAAAGADGRSPVVRLPDGTWLIDPTDVAVVRGLGFTTELRDSDYDVVIVGAGPAGLSASVYAASEGLSTLAVEREAIGGQAGSSSLIRNYLGFSRGVSGAELATRAYQQAWVFGAKVLMMSEVVDLAAADAGLTLTLSDGALVRARSIVLAMGVAYRRLGVPELEALTGAGVFYGASISEAQALEGERVYVLGGGNSAGQAALYLARYAAAVTVVIRGASLVTSMSRYLIDQIDAAPNVEVRAGQEVVGGRGRGRLEELDLRDRETGRVTPVPAAGLFILIGARPHTDWLPAEVARDERGFVLTGPDADGAAGDAGGRAPFATTMPGVFAVGDVRHGSIKRVASATGEGAGVVQQVFRLLEGAG